MLKHRFSRIAVLALTLTVLIGAAFTAWAKRDARYVGSEECALCHDDTHGALMQAFNKTHHRHAMTDVSEGGEAADALFTKLFNGVPPDWSGAPIEKEDVKYVLGVSASYQNFLDKDLKLLPAKWDSKEKKWVKIDAEDGVTQCVGCHTTNFDPAAKKWTELGVGCEMCHGPGGEHSDSMDAADIINPRNLDAAKRSMVCGQCHGFGTDTTGKLAFSPTFIPGQDLNEHFKLKEIGDRIQNVQYNGFVASEHGKGGMMCTTCHDPHGDKTKGPHQLRRPINDLCQGCHKPTIGTLEEHAPNAGANDTCATCHMIDGSHAFKKAKPIE